MAERNRYSPYSAPSFIGGALIILAGVVLLLDNFGVVSARDVFRLWPALLVLFGVRQIVRGYGSFERIFGLIVAIAGVLWLSRRLGWYDPDWRYVLPALLILLGVGLLTRTLAARSESGGLPGPRSASRLNEWAAFGGGRYVSNAKDFQGGEVAAVFGGYEVDLAKADIAGPEAVLNVFAAFGSVEIRVPEDWSVECRGTPILGGFEDHTAHRQLEPGAPEKRLVVRGMAIFGGVEIKN